MLYLLSIGLLASFWRIIRKIQSLKEEHGTVFIAGREDLDRFLHFYESSPWWLLSSFFGSLFATTIGASGGIPLDLVAMSIFVLPAVWFYKENRPFGVRCESYSPSEGKEGESICYPTNGVYTVLLDVSAGANITDFRLDMQLPAGLKVISTDTNKTSIDDENVLYGTSPPKEDQFIEAVYFEPTLDNVSDDEIHVRDKQTGKLLTSITLK